jgi:WD40 repeat protein
MSANSPSIRTVVRIANGEEIQTICALPETGQFATGDQAGLVKLWEPVRGSMVRCLRGHSGEVLSSCLLSDGRLCTGSRDHSIRVWKPSTGQCLKVLRGGFESADSLWVDGHGRLVSLSVREKTMHVWDIEAGTSTAEAVVDDATYGVAEVGALLPDGRILVR